MLISYLTFLFKSKNRHGVHSPFVFDFIDKGMKLKISKEKIRDLIIIRERAFKSKEIINVTDFGSGSRVFKSNRRSVKKIAQYASISFQNSKKLMKILNYFQPGSILEIGTSIGLATATFSIANPKSKIVTLEGCANTLNYAKSTFKKFKLNNIETVEGNFNLTLPKTLKIKKWDLIYIDGNHSEQATLNYFYHSLPYIYNESILIFDDIHWSTGMEKAWKKIKSHSKVTISIDTFQWGIVFVRKEQEKEHFVLRI